MSEGFAFGRRYNVWGGSPRGTAEDKTRCVVEVWATEGFGLPYQCSNKRGKGVRGDLCGTHARHEAMGKRLSIPEDVQPAKTADRTRAHRQEGDKSGD